MDTTHYGSWADIVDYEGRYQISDLSFVRNIVSGKILKGWKDSNNYNKVQLGERGLKDHRYVHILVAQHFIPNPLNLPEVNHLKGKDDNRSCSLEWCTHVHNMNHAKENKLMNGLKGDKNHFSKLKECDVVNIKQDIVKKVAKKDIADKYGICVSTVYKISHREIWSHLK